MAIYHTLKLFAKHPLTKSNPVKHFLKFVLWQLFCKVFDATIIYKFTDRAELLVKKGMTGATGNLYFGLHEFEDMAFLLHFLRSEDVFFDIGANVGSYTVLASAQIGAYTFCFEPRQIGGGKLILPIIYCRTKNYASLLLEKIY
ncbi:MAG: hypothetical protein EAZ53_08995 [Bacteroidetes bacterium]|nr:MAG: hypothetical protein EAZ53_08995 [Bacteroidota bacterium]